MTTTNTAVSPEEDDNVDNNELVGVYGPTNDHNEVEKNGSGGRGGNGDGNGNVELELTPELKQSDSIVTSFVFQKKINSIVVTLNHAYSKKIIISPINNSDWSKT